MTDVQRDLVDKMRRALNRANAMTDQWAGDTTLITRSAAADLFASALELNGWEQTDAHPPLRSVPALSDVEAAR